MIYNVLKDFVLSNVGKLKLSSKGWKSRNCMLCQSRGYTKDTRGRFGLKIESTSISSNCFNCAFSSHWDSGTQLSTSFKFLLKHLGADDNFIKSIEFEIYKETHNLFNNQLQQDNKEEKIRSLFDKWPTKSLPDDSLSITEWLESGCTDPDFLQVTEYAIKRRILSLHEFYWCPSIKNQLNKRLIIPYYYKQNIVGFTARYAEDLKEKIIPKYHQSCPENFVYNLDHQDDWNRKYVILTEGVLDAWAVNGISSLGEINQEKIDIINRLQKDIIVCTDRDKNGKMLVDAAINNNWMVSYPKWDNNIKDAAQAAEKYGKLLTIHSIISSAMTGKDRILLNWNILQNERNKRY